MSFLSNLFNKSKKNIFSEAEESAFSIPATQPPIYHSSVPEHIHSPYIYDSPTYSGIRSNIAVHQTSLLIQYHDLAYIASTLDDSIVVGAPIKHSHTGKAAEEYNRIFEKNCAFATENFKKNIKLSRKLDSHLFTRVQLFENIRDIYQDFGKNMKNKVSTEDYDLYHTNMANLKKSLMVDVKEEPFKLLSETLAEAKKKISEIVETFGFSRACEIEDRFIISEIDKYFAQLAKAPQEKQLRAKKATIKLENGNKISTIDLANKLRDERVARLSKYSSIHRLEEKSSSKTTTLPEDHDEHK